MAVVKDPEGRETAALNAMVDFKDRSVLEIGCGDGRLTWRYAAEAARVVAIDPDVERIGKAKANTPDDLKEHVSFMQFTLGDYANSCKDEKFDIALFPWTI